MALLLPSGTRRPCGPAEPIHPDREGIPAGGRRPARRLDRAREAGVVGPDLASADLVPLMCAVAYAVQVHDSTADDRIDTAHRYLATLLGGLRATPPNA
ncbi:hypothetical protein ACIA98_03105 [Streptomyces sp. NPDC051366]|uniref:hypothetical protein n=1 Tax=Streptomyces sp. NPDC051366 TaxID=3365652 RepID=UPI0037A2AE13